MEVVEPCRLCCVVVVVILLVSISTPAVNKVVCEDLDPREADRDECRLLFRISMALKIIRI